MRKVRVYYKGRYYYLGKAKNLEEELNLKSVLIYDSLVEMPQNMQLKPLNHYI